MRKIHKIFSVALSLVFGAMLFAGCGGGTNGDSETNDTFGGWHYGTGAPAGSLGKNGDLYLDYSDWSVYTKDDGAWTQRGSIRGEQGPQGSQGQTGGTGPQGETGSGWHYGDGVPDGSLGKNGDLYLDFATWDVYAKENGAWVMHGNLREEPASSDDYFKKMTMTEGDILIFDASSCGNDPAKIRFALSVQGLFAQIGESKYFYMADGMSSTWLTELRTKYHKASRTVTADEMAADFYDHFAGEYVLYNMNDAASVNCARTIAGAEQAAMVDSSLTAWAAEKRLTQKADATSMTEKQCFDLYKDKLDNSAVVQLEGGDLGLTDYVIACQYFCYYPGGDQMSNGLSPEHPFPPTDELEPFREEVLEWCTGAVFGTFPLGEYGTVKLNSYYDHPTVVGAGLYNTSVYNCVDFFGETALSQPYAPSPDEPLDPAKYPLDKHYVTIVNGDGDNVGCWYNGTFDNGYYCGQRQETLHFFDAERGNFPMGWELNPSLYTLAPNIIRHTYDNAQAGDTFVCSISGFGHTFLRYFTDDALKRLTRALDRSIAGCDLSVVKILDDHSLNDEEEDHVLNAFAQMKHADGFLYCTYDGAYKLDGGAVRWVDGKPFVSCRLTLWNTFDPNWNPFDTPESAAASINGYSTDSKTIDAYSYVNLHVWSRDYNDVKTMVGLLDEDVQVVDPVTFLRLIQERVPHVDAAPKA